MFFWSRRILTKTVPNSLKIRVTSDSRTMSDSSWVKLQISSQCLKRIQEAKANVLGNKDAGRRRVDSLSVNALRLVVVCCELTSPSDVRGGERVGLGKQSSMRRHVGKDVVGRHGFHLERGG